MKKMTYLFLTGAFMLAISTTEARAQNSFASNPDVSTLNFTPTDVETKSAEVKNLNTAAVNDFERKNKNVSEVIWTSTNNFSSVYFKKEGVQMRSTYNEKGRLEYTISYLKGKQIPRSVTSVVRENGYMMPVNQVIAVGRHSDTHYFVQMEDQYTHITLLVKNREVELYKEITKPTVNSFK